MDVLPEKLHLAIKAIHRIIQLLQD